MMDDSDKIVLMARKQQAPEKQATADDQRSSKRFNYEAPLIIKNCAGGTYAYGIMYNYSRGGIYFESDEAFKPGTCVRIDLDESQNVLAADHYYATVKWCNEIHAAVVLYDYAIGIEFDRELNSTAGTEKLRIIKGGADQNNKPDPSSP